MTDHRSELPNLSAWSVRPVVRLPKKSMRLHKVGFGAVNRQRSVAWLIRPEPFRTPSKPVHALPVWVTAIRSSG